MYGILAAVSVPLSGVYNSYEDLIQHLNERMEREGYKIVKVRSHRSRMGGADVPNNAIVRCDLVCDRGGRPYKCTATKHKTTTKKTDCPWKAKAVNRKTVGGWVLTIVCDEHNHEPGTPEHGTPEPVHDEEEDTETAVAEVPTQEAETLSALQVAGVPDTTLRLTGDTFNQLKGEYSKLSSAERMQVLSNLQLRIAAMYAVENETMQRQQRKEAQEKRQNDMESSNMVQSNKRQRVNMAEDLGPEAEQLQDHLQADGQLLGQQLIGETQFHMDHAAAQPAVPMPDMEISQFQHFVNNSRRGRGPTS